MESLNESKKNSLTKIKKYLRATKQIAMLRWTTRRQSTTLMIWS